MRRNIYFLVALFVTTVALMALQKPLFLLWYSEQAAQASAAEWLAVVANGLKLDLTVAGYITALPLLIVGLALWFPARS